MIREKAVRNESLEQTNASIVKNDVRMVWEVDAISAKTNSTTQDVRAINSELNYNRMRAIAFRNGTLDSNAGRNVKRSADV